jgi:hypothetical protein
MSVSPLDVSVVTFDQLTELPEDEDEDGELPHPAANTAVLAAATMAAIALLVRT